MFGRSLRVWTCLSCTFDIQIIVSRYIESVETLSRAAKGAGIYPRPIFCLNAFSVVQHQLAKHGVERKLALLALAHDEHLLAKAGKVALRRGERAKRTGTRGAR